MRRILPLSLLIGINFILLSQKRHSAYLYISGAIILNAIQCHQMTFNLQASFLHFTNLRAEPRLPPFGISLL